MNGRTILRAAERPAQAWKNGGGTTREIAIGGARPDGRFDWRVSIADVTVSGPFSLFPGVDRTLCVLEGRLSLAVGGDRATVLDAQTPPFAFAGDVAAHGEPLGGAVRDLNVMVRRGCWRADVTRRIGTGSIDPAPIVMVVATAPATVGDDRLAPFDAALRAGGEAPLAFASDAPILVIRLAMPDAR